MELVLTGAEGNTDEKVLDAALTVLADRGTKLATMDDIADASGTSRATLFRRFGGKDRLFEIALTRELRRFLGAITTTFRTVTDPTDRIAEAFVACLALRRRFLTSQPSRERGWELLSLLDQGDPAPLEIAHRFITARIVAGQDEGTLPGGDPEIRAEAILRLTLGYLLVPSTLIDLDDRDAARDLARRTIAPLATGPL